MTDQHWPTIRFSCRIVGQQDRVSCHNKSTCLWKQPLGGMAAGGLSPVNPCNPKSDAAWENDFKESKHHCISLHVHEHHTCDNCSLKRCMCAANSLSFLDEGKGGYLHQRGNEKYWFVTSLKRGVAHLQLVSTLRIDPLPSLPCLRN